MITLSVPVKTRKKFADEVGVTVGVVNKWVERGYVQVRDVGRYSMIDLLSFDPARIPKDEK